jgi:hypothetical protein
MTIPSQTRTLEGIGGGRLSGLAGVAIAGEELLRRGGPPVDDDNGGGIVALVGAAGTGATLT